MQVLAGIGLGANLGEPAGQIGWAFDKLSALPHTTLLARSRLYRSAPIGPAGQPDYCNAAALLQTALSPLQLLAAVQALENLAGRKRNVPRWSARLLDLDVLFHGSTHCHTALLTLPHPELQHRNFVLTPLAEIAPAVSIPGLGLVAPLAARLPQNGLTLWQ